jgi:alcohol dehydrogenase, propanol-preferring
MKAARYHRGDDYLRIDEVGTPMPRRGEVLVKVKAAGVCHTDLHFLEGAMKSPDVITLGHEIAGEITDAGEGVPKERIGERVLVNNCEGCGNCEQCREGRGNLCDNLVQLGFSADGGYAENVRVRADCAIPMEGISYDEAAALTCGAASCYHALTDIAELRLGETVLINGMGGLGFSAVQIAKLAGATTIVVDVVQPKLDLALKKFGADHAVNGAETDVASEVRAITKCRGVDLVLELVGIFKTMSYGIDALSKRGRMVLVGHTNDEFSVLPLKMIKKEASVLSSVAYRASDLIAVRDLAASGKLRPLIAERYKLDQVNAALQELRKGTVMGRSVLTF